MDWEDTFRGWGKAPSSTEQTKCENAETAIRKAIAADATLSNKEVTAFPQGSYCNRTNVRQDSDVDICILNTNTFFYKLPEGMTLTDAGIVGASYHYPEYKNDVEKALVSYLGQDAVTRGKKAFDIHKNSYRIDADAVACFEYRRYNYSHEGRQAPDDLFGKEEGDQFFSEIKHRFLVEVEAVEQLDWTDGWAFTVNGKSAEPNVMQRRIAWLVREYRRIGNWSGVGSGKTISALLSSRICHMTLTVIITNYPTISGWVQSIKNVYPDSEVFIEPQAVLASDPSHYRYLVLNYEKFQNGGRHQLVQQLLMLGIQFIVLDEIQLELHRIWRRGEEKCAKIKAGGFHEQNAASLHKRIQAAGSRAFQNQWKS